MITESIEYLFVSNTLDLDKHKNQRISTFDKHSVFSLSTYSNKTATLNSKLKNTIIPLSLVHDGNYLSNVCFIHSIKNSSYSKGVYLPSETKYGRIESKEMDIQLQELYIKYIEDDKFYTSELIDDLHIFCKSNNIGFFPIVFNKIEESDIFSILEYLQFNNPFNYNLIF